MTLKVFTQLFALFSALTATIVAIYWLKQGHMDAFWTSLGISRSDSRINWCEERVDTLHFYETGSKLLEKDGKWMWVGNTEKELDYLRVEKWFARYCQIPVDPITAPTESGAQAVFEAAFIDGGRLSLYEFPSGSFKVRDQVFNSETLRKGLKELLAFGEKN